MARPTVKAPFDLEDISETASYGKEEANDSSKLSRCAAFSMQLKALPGPLGACVPVSVERENSLAEGPHLTKQELEQETRCTKPGRTLSYLIVGVFDQAVLSSPRISFGALLLKQGVFLF